MSCEDDYDYYDNRPVEEIKTIVQSVQVEIKTLTKEKAVELENALVKCLRQKEEKLNIILKNLSVCTVPGGLFIHDRYGTAVGLKEIAEAFGMSIKQVSASRKGKCYLLSDPLVEILKLLQSEYNFGQDIATASADEEILSLAKAEGFQFEKIASTYGGIVSDAVRSLKATGRFTREGQATIEETYLDGRLRSSKEVAFRSDREEVELELKNFLKNIGEQIAANNQNMQNGTTELLYQRARQMGYAVQKERKGDQIQLVMVRLQA